jgi:hypothetical protein
MQPLEKGAGRKEKERLQPIFGPSPFSFLRSEVYRAGNSSRQIEKFQSGCNIDVRFA